MLASVLCIVCTLLTRRSQREQTLPTRDMRKRGYRSEWGLCKGGKTILQLLKDLSALDGADIHRLVIMIGTNDILKMAESDFQLGKEKSRIRHHLQQLKSKMYRKCEEIVWCTVPPIPRLMLKGGETTHRYNVLHKAVNDEIATFANDKISVIDISHDFLETADMESLFESFMGSGEARREDAIHWNTRGMDMAIKKIKSHIISSLELEAVKNK